VVEEDEVVAKLWKNIKMVSKTYSQPWRYAIFTKKIKENHFFLSERDNL
jgi:hypothetical protein